MSDRAWAPECTEDELLVAMVNLKRAFHARSIGVDPGAFPVLHHLAAHGPVRQNALADALGLDASTVSRHVRGLAAEGHVAVGRDPDDGRATLLSLTPSGRQYLEQRMQAHRSALQAATAEFDPAERAELVRLLHKLADALSH